MACAAKSPDQKLAGAIDPAASWVATLEFTCDQWLRNRVPTSFVRETVKSSRKALAKITQAADDSKASADLKRDVSRLLRSADVATDELDAAIRRGDRPAVVRARSRFAQAYAGLHEIEEKHP